MMRDAGVDRVDSSVEVECLVRVARGITVEVLTCSERRRLLLVGSPTVRGVTILAEGRLDEVEVFARVGSCVLRALSDVVPLVTGGASRARQHSEGMPAVVRQ